MMLCRAIGAVVAVSGAKAGRSFDALEMSKA